MGGIVKFIQIVKKAVADILFPFFCFGCKKEGVLLCKKCFNQCIPKATCKCALCEISLIRGNMCCTDSLSKVYAMHTLQEGGILQTLIHALKYKYVTEIVDILEQLYKKSDVSASLKLVKYDVIVSVPLHPRRFAERGFNQSELIARFIGEDIGVPVKNEYIMRDVYTKQQARLKKTDRIQNMSNVFLCRKSVNSIVGQRVLLVDDIYTTGATMRACARSLRNAGVVQVDGFVIGIGK